MKKSISVSKRLLSFLLTFTIIFSLFSGVITVHADPVILGVRFERIKDTSMNDPKEALYIYGSNFIEPTVTAGSLGIIPVAINEALSTTSMIVIDDVAALKEIKGRPNIIRVTAETDTGTATDTENVDLSSLPTVSGVSSSKVYVGDPLTISGSGFDTLGKTTDAFSDTLYISNKPYIMDTECTISDGRIDIDPVKDPIDQGVSDIRIERTSGICEIRIIYSDSITVVNKLTGIEVERIDPNSGPKSLRNVISIYGRTGLSNFSDDMRIFVEGSEGTNKGVIKDGSGQITGVKFELPTRATAGTVDLILTSKNLGSEFVIPGSFVYLDIGNTLTIDSDGVNPNFKKETEQKIVEIKGRNIGFFNGTGYDNLSGVARASDFNYGYGDYGNYTMFKDKLYYKIKYTGKYQSATGPVDVTIIRQIRTTIDGDATVVDDVYGGIDYTPVFQLSKDTIYVSPIDVNLEPNEPKSVDVSMETITTIFRETGTATPSIIYNRTEKYILPNGFTYLPDEITPAITSVTPEYGPGDKEIYMTIIGTDFQVLEDGEKPRVRIGGRECTVTGVYDNENRVVDGKLITTGTKIKLRLPAGTAAEGAADVVVINPSDGQKTLTNGFEFRQPGADSKIPYIDNLKEKYADLRGGDISGERVLITGGNIFTSADNNHRVVITIDGEKAVIVGRVSSDGKTVTIIPPPGTIPGMTKLQVINEDGSMTSADFEYKLVTSAPKITKIVPDKGGKGAKLVIKGEDFILPDETIEDPNDPRRKGTTVLLGGRELNAYNYGVDGSGNPIIVKNGSGSIYYYNPQYDPDGTGGIAPYELNGAMVTVIDSSTIYVDLPDRFYSFGGGSAPYLTSQSIPLGDLKVEVLNPDGARSKENIIFEYMRPLTNPVVSSMSPNSGSIDGGTVVTLTGSGFKEDNLEVYFGSEEALNVDFINATQIRATVPEYPYSVPGNIDEFIVPVMVVNYDGGTAVRDGAEGFTYKIPSSHPVITALKNSATDSLVTNGSSAGGDEIIIEGLDFRRATAGGNPPDVYFNGVKAEVEWPSNNTDLITEKLVVTIPASDVSGPVDIVLVNYDAGSCTYTGFSYTMSAPAITSITPNIVSNLGNVNLEIKGTGFRYGNLESLFELPGGAKEQVGRETDSPEDAGDEISTIVIFGDETTGDKKSIDTIVGPYNTVIDDLRFVFERVDQATANIRVLRASDNSQVIRQLRNEDNEVVPTPMELDIPVGSSHMFILNHSTDLGVNNSFDEGILVEVTPESVIITRRIAPYASVGQNGQKITATAPPVSTEGSRNIYVINDDNGKASGRINIVSPDSNPVIESVEPVNYGLLDGVVEAYNPEIREQYSELYTYVPVDGGAFLTIKGSDYRRNVKVYLEDKLLEIVSKSANDDELVVKVPPGTEDDVDKLYRIIIVNEDGGVADSSLMDQPYYVEYQLSLSEPVVESIVPERSSNGKANTVTIYGYGFEGQVVVSLDGVPCVTTRDTAKPGSILHVTIPAGISPGPKLVMVQNGDYGYCEVQDGITIISSPHIDTVLNSNGQIMDPVVFSIEGGENIQLKGAGFMTGAKVILGGELKPKSELAEGESGIECLGPDNTEMVVVGGIQVQNVTVTPEDTISFTTPKLVTSETSIIVINEDGGVSNVIDADYEKPAPDRPTGVEIEAVDGDTIRLEWDKIEGVIYYELYISESKDGKRGNKLDDYRYFASVIPEELDDDRVVYFIEELIPETWYSVKIRAANYYTFSNFTAATKYVLTDELIRNTNYQGTDEFLEAMKEDKVVFKGPEVIFTTGEKSLGGSDGTTADFDKQYYGSASQKLVEMNFLLIKKYPGSRLTIKDKGLEISMTAGNLAVDEAIMVNSALHKDTQVRVCINRNLAARGDDIIISLPKGYKLLTNPFGMEVEMQVEREATSLRGIKGEASMTIKYDEAKAGLFPGGIYIAYYDSYERKLTIIQTEKLNNALKAKISKSGEYMIIGKMTK
ncbi:MAG TPA: IPT/TIG domain-containing protein [Clostridia bacterium]|nr:IPT/TIG domain-containing protein [Clostridia bacterium]